MNFKTHNDVEVPIGGTSLQGYIHCTYAELERVFDEPTVGDGYKIDAEWEILFEDGTVATIYNWKNGKNYLGSEDGIPVRHINVWNVGGRGITAISRVKDALNISKKIVEGEDT